MLSCIHRIRIRIRTSIYDETLQKLSRSLSALPVPRRPFYPRQKLFLLSRDKVGTFCCLLACYFWRKVYLKHTRYLEVLIQLPTYRRTVSGMEEGREGKGRDNKRGKELFFSIEKFRLSLWIKKTEWHGTSLWAGFSFSLFLFLFLLHSFIHTDMHLSITLHTHLPRKRERERDYCSRLDGRANGD